MLCGFPSSGLKCRKSASKALSLGGVRILITPRHALQFV